MDVLFLILGMALLIAGAHFLTEGSAAIAKRLRISEFVIGLTIVGFGTSAPELVVSTLSAIKGQGDMAVGNVVGSNLFNIMLILGIVAMVRPVEFSKSNLSRDLPLATLATIVLIIMGIDTWLGQDSVNVITRGEGMVLLCFFAIFMAYTFFTGRDTESATDATDDEAGEARPMKIWIMILMVFGGLAGLVFGGDMLVHSATELARAWGVSESLIAVTIVAGGTSLPELATSVAAIIKRQNGLALGNVIGSNIFNIFLILGVSATVNPLTLSGVRPEDLFMLLVSNVLLFAFALTPRRHTMGRWEGAISVAIYVGYVVWAMMR